MCSTFSRCVQFLVLTACTAGLVQADEPFLLRYKLDKGATRIAQARMENKTTQKIMGKDIDVVMDQTAVAVQAITDVDAEGTAKIKTKTERLKTSAKIATAGDFEFDSQKTERDKSSTLGAALTPLYERLVGSELDMEVTSRGVIKSYTGYSQLVGDLTKDNPLASQFAGGGSDDAAKLSAQGHWLVMPEAAVKPGDKWDNPFEIDLKGLGLMKGKETVTFLSVEKRDGHDIGKFSISNDIAFDLKLDMGAAKVSGKISTTNSSGSAEFDITAGKLLQHKSELTLSGDLSVDVNGMMIPVAVSQTVSSDVTALDKLPE